MGFTREDIEKMI